MRLGTLIITKFANKIEIVNNITQIRKPIEKELEKFDSLFESTLNNADGLLGQICSGIKERKGKLMRPILVLLIAKEWGEVNMSAYYSALTLELLHNASLVHDDIVDESDERRGKPSVRAMFGNKAAVLAGDFLLSSALETASLSNNIRIVNNVSILGKQLSEGEIIQLTKTRHTDFSEETYYQVIRLKTASLFNSAAQLGAISASQNEETIMRMGRLGNIIGICFQIRDDIFDYYDNNVGKPTGSDMAEGKLTLPALYAINSTNNKEILEIAGKIKQGTATPTEIASLIEFTKLHGGIEYAQKCMNDFANEAKTLIADFKNQEVKQALTAYIDFVSQRTI